MQKSIEFWNVIGDEGAFYTLEYPDGRKRDFLKKSTPLKLNVSDKVAILVTKGLRTIVRKVSQTLTTEDMQSLVTVLK